MSRKIADHNSRVRMLLFFARPLHIFNILLFVKIWKLMSYGPSTLENYFRGRSAVYVTQVLWREEFSSYIWYFLIAAVIDVIVVEYLPLIRNE